jgi:hypothetical protein
LFQLTSAGSIATVGSALINNPATFATVETPPPTVPPNLKFEQT